jgi:hypothetical protein
MGTTPPQHLLSRSPLFVRRFPCPLRREIGTSRIYPSMLKLTYYDVEFSWTADCQQSFDLLKKIIVSDPVLIMPDPNNPFIIACDASDHSGSAALIQADDDGLRHPVAYWNHKWTSSQIKWPTRDKEC